MDRSIPYFATFLFRQADDQFLEILFRKIRDSALFGWFYFSHGWRLSAFSPSSQIEGQECGSLEAAMYNKPPLHSWGLELAGTLIRSNRNSTWRRSTSKRMPLQAGGIHHHRFAIAGRVRGPAMGLRVKNSPLSVPYRGPAGKISGTLGMERTLWLTRQASTTDLPDEEASLVRDSHPREQVRHIHEPVDLLIPLSPTVTQFCGVVPSANISNCAILNSSSNACARYSKKCHSSTTYSGRWKRR